MKFRIVLSVIGTVLKLLGVLLLVPGFVALIYNEICGIIAFSLAALSSLFFGIILSYVGTKGEIGQKEAFGAVALGWLCAAFFGALPFALLGLSMVDGLFESISGFSATGATILAESNSQGYYIVNQTLANNSIGLAIANVAINELASANVTTHVENINTYYGLLFWRSFQQLIGGMGIILVIVAIFPHLHVAGRQLFKAETVGPTKDTITPRATKTARILWEVYLLFNAIEIILLIAAGMPVYDSICNSFSTLATGGFSPQASSIAAYNSPLIEAIITIFVVLGMSSFALHYKVLTCNRFGWFKDEEFRFMIFILAVGTLILILFGGLEGDLLTRFRFASFEVVSIMGTCGFVSTMDYDNWSTAAKLTLIILMLIGGCIGSTSGGVKVGRLLVDLKYTYRELFHMLHPKSMLLVRLGGITVRQDVLRAMLFYSFFYLATWLALSLMLAMVSADNSKVDLLVVTSGIASCLGGVGPGFGILTFDWSQMSGAGKMIGFFAMYIGRLELMPIFLLFIPELWGK